MYIFLILAAAFFWGGVGIPIRGLAVFGFSTTQIVLVRFLTVTAAFGIYILLTDRRKFRIEKKDVKYLFLLSLFSILLYNICITVTMQMTSLSIAIGLMYTAPIWAMLLSIRVFKESFTKRKAAAIALSFTGCALMTGLLSGGNMLLTPLVLLAGIVSGIGYGSQSVFIKKFMEKYSQLTIIFYIFLFAALASILFCNPPQMARIFSEHPTAFIYGIGGFFVFYVVPFAMYTYSLNFITASKAAVVVSIEPFFTALYGLVLYNEPITPPVFAGTSLIIFAIIILREKQKTDNAVQI